MLVGAKAVEDDVTKLVVNDRVADKEVERPAEKSSSCVPA